MAVLRNLGFMTAIGLSLAMATSHVNAKGHSGGKSHDGQACSYDKCVDKCVAKTGVGNFANARCSQKCVKRGCT